MRKRVVLMGVALLALAGWAFAEGLDAPVLTEDFIWWDAIAAAFTLVGVALIVIGLLSQQAPRE
ncbi:hypothetical protein [Phycicoccus avicenniae]|uniref:hypothetical protein n=1 Tax=Phycicoccus avicenniae TaxID=2828860 RepID=UPI003D2D46F5